MPLTSAAKRTWQRLGAAVDTVVAAGMRRGFSGTRKPASGEDRRALLEKLIEAYGDPRFISEPDRFFAPPSPIIVAEKPVDQRGSLRVVDLSYRSGFVPHYGPYRDEYAAYGENQVAHARMWRRGVARPTAICLHGYGGGTFWFEERAFLVRWLDHIGLDVVLLQLPFHGRRAPAAAPALFPSAHVVRTNEAFSHAIMDLRALTGWLLGRGAPHVGIMGMSLGGYTSALYASLDPRLAFAVPMIPAVSFSDLMWRHGDGSPERARAEAAGVTKSHLERLFRVHSPLARPAQVPIDHRLIIAGEGDRICPPDHARRLWEHWGQAPGGIHWFPGGHIAQIGRGAGFRKIRTMLAAAKIL